MRACSLPLATITEANAALPRWGGIAAGAARLFWTLEGCDCKVMVVSCSPASALPQMLSCRGQPFSCRKHPAKAADGQHTPPGTHGPCYVPTHESALQAH